MSIIVDTCVWSYALRRRDNSMVPSATTQLNQLIQQRKIIMLGAIRQEILSGIRHETQFERIRLKLRAFPDYPVSISEIETAAQFYNHCRSHGIQGSNTDFLLCAVAYCHDFTVYTQDKDFYHFQQLLDFKLNLIS